MGKGSLYRKVNWGKFSDGYENIWGKGHILATMKKRHVKLGHWIAEMVKEREALEEEIRKVEENL